MSSPVSPDNAIGRVSRMDAINNKSVVDAALLKAEEKLKKLELILGRIEDPDFGKCMKCRQPIPEGRKFRPQGKLFCMTQLYRPQIAFENWYYKNDATHIFIYQKETTEYIREQSCFKEVKIDGRLISFCVKYKNEECEFWML